MSRNVKSFMISGGKPQRNGHIRVTYYLRSESLPDNSIAWKIVSFPR